MRITLKLLFTSAVLVLQLFASTARVWSSDCQDYYDSIPPGSTDFPPVIRLSGPSTLSYTAQLSSAGVCGYTIQQAMSESGCADTDCLIEKDWQEITADSGWCSPAVFNPIIYELSNIGNKSANVNLVVTPNPSNALRPTVEKSIDEDFNVVQNGTTKVSVGLRAYSGTVTATVKMKSCQDYVIEDPGEVETTITN